MVGGVRGSHIVLPRFAGAPNAAVYTEAVDKRPIFVIPWNEQVLVGTTEVADQGDPAKVQPSHEEIDYLVRSFVHLFPQVKLSAGGYPLYLCRGPASSLCAQGERLGGDPQTLPSRSRSGWRRAHDFRDWRQIDHGGGTGAAVRGQDWGVAEIFAGRSPSPPAESAALLLDQWVIEIGGAGGISEGTARGIVEWHGKRALDISRMAQRSPDLRAPLCSHSEHIVAEAVDAFAGECAVTLGDVLLRRVPVALGACWSPACSREAAARIGAVMGWDDAQSAAQLEAFEIERAAFLRKPARMNAVLEAAAD